MDVGVRELKQHLSEYLDRAAQGEIIRVTDRGEPKALLVPLPGRLLLDRGIAEGWVRPGSGRPLRPIEGATSKTSIAASLGEDRDER